MLVNIALYVFAAIWQNIPLVVVAGLLGLVVVAISVGFYMIQPNMAAVLTLFGDYKGSDRTSGLRSANPLYMKRKVSLRVRNFTTANSKVNDANGNPIDIAAVARQCKSIYCGFLKTSMTCTRLGPQTSFAL